MECDNVVGGDEMVNINKLKGKIVERGMNVETLANIVGMDRATLYRKINANGESFTIKEADSISKALNLTYEEVNSIFFSQYVA